MKTEIEWKTDDLRVVRKNGVVIRVQRRWLVASGETYRADSPRHAEHREITDGGNLRSLVHVTPVWTHTSSEWRDLPSVEFVDY